MGKPTARTKNLQRRGFTSALLNPKHAQVCKRKLARSTTTNYNAALRLWEEFCAYDETPSNMKDGAKPPESHLIKRFLKWWAASSVGRIQQTVNLTSAEVTWQRLQATIYRTTRSQVSRTQNEDILAWVRTELAEDMKLTREKEKKRFCDGVVYTNLMRQLWCCDADDYVWERDRAQVGFMLQMHFFAAARPGALMPTGYYPDLYLAYQDVDFVLLRMTDKTEKFAMIVTQRWRKGEKEEIDENLRVLWVEEDNLLNCPVHHFLSLAFADNAFVDIKCPSDLVTMELGPCEDLRIFPYKCDIRNKPFLVNRDGKPLPYSRFWYNLKELSFRAGYIEWVRPYDIRRGTGTKLDEAPEVSTNSLTQIMGHVNGGNTFKRHYQSDISGVDIKGIVLRGKADQGYSTEALRRNRRLNRTPSRLPSRLHQDFLAKWKETTWADPDTSRTTHGNRARKAAWKEFRASWGEHFKTACPEQPCSSSNIRDSVELLGDLDRLETKSRIMMRYDEHRRIIKDEIANPAYSLRTSPALDSMSTLAGRNYSHPAVFYPGTEPIESGRSGVECRLCHSCLDKKPVKQQQIHVEGCAARCRTLSSEKRWKPRRCHRCNTWFNRLDAYRNHCKKHYEELDDYCGILRLRNIVVSAGRCPFCLADPQLRQWNEWEKVVQAFTTSDDFMGHLNEHIRDLPQSGRPCPHPKCDQTRSHSLPDLLHHFYDHHGIAEDLFGTENFPSHPNTGVEDSLLVETEDFFGAAHDPVQPSADVDDSLFVQTGELFSTEHFPSHPIPDDEDSLLVPEDGASAVWGAQKSQNLYLDWENNIDFTRMETLIDDFYGPSQSTPPLGSPGIGCFQLNEIHSQPGELSPRGVPQVLSKRLLRQRKIRAKRKERSSAR